MPDKAFPITTHLRLYEDDPKADIIREIKCYHCPSTLFIRSTIIGNYTIIECASCGKFSAISTDIVDFESIKS